VLKNLSNMNAATMIENGSDYTGIISVNTFKTALSADGILANPISAIPKNTAPHYNISVLHPSLVNNADSNNETSITTILSSSDIPDVQGNTAHPLFQLYSYFYGSTPAIFSSIVNPSLMRGNVGATIRLVYNMVGARLLMENKNLFINETEYNDLIYTKDLMLKQDSNPTFMRRPLLQSNLNEILTVVGLNKEMDLITVSDSSEIVRSWE